MRIFAAKDSQFSSTEWTPGVKVFHDEMLLVLKLWLSVFKPPNLVANMTDNKLVC